MSATIAEIELPTEEFALSETLSEIEDLEFEVERFVAHDADHVMPFVWVSGDDGDRIGETLERDGSVEDLQLLSELDGEWLYRMEWIDQIETLVRILVEEDGSILAAFGDESGWQLRVLFPERDALSRTYDYCRDAGLTMDIRSIYRLDDGREGRFGLTDEQQDTLVAAYERGYFDVPREITLTDLADEIGISHQALSERLRRGEKSVLENTVIVGSEGE
ncbi:helix-turn-helix domain-containing protein [Halalkalicoccus sp. NIPERK01]|uniref:helix-turn-helix domain-containing protein n=1 Tax=Halalkalicoccus sp. NIPERK01 TaxID=3053469 RepID=UPI00256EFC19|nr:helix-turn-helix domain-containing protein [Halalkalicoccus sp. NIPERK01]MDL5362958.1 helix-turn-helix domain-containing protein [Halalkalicoccus sp. NIPERK01]